ncbi:hypothetical protein OIE68_13185 [Nocardia vinacea]|uniref:Uncharacterized protein n=1 Tax=Nocardia vinacea TaxID=96468 RepID=A0ABZ1YT44_9NOCA|nr:hypothetical protein OIE68_13185 [Nocardia vinacea]
MNSRIIRRLAIFAFALPAIALSGGTASAAAATATPVGGSVELCIPIPLGSAENTFCLPIG